MAQGMWTKCFSPEGNVFYYNSTLNKSEWIAPPNSVTHEAEKLQIPKKEDLDASEAALEEQRKRKIDSTDVKEDDTEKKSSSTGSKEKESSESGNGGKDSIATNSEDTKKESKDLAEQLLSSVIPTLTQQHPQRQHRSKRFKSADKNAECQEDSNDPKSSYQKMVNTYQAMAGENGEGGKWLVR